MARGHPDFFGQSTFYKFGDLLDVNGNTLIPFGGWGDVIEILYKGKTYSGWIYWYGDLPIGNYQLRMTLDGELITITNPSNALLLGIINAKTQPFRMINFQLTAIGYYFTFELNKDYTFDYQCKIEFLNSSAIDVTVQYDLIFAVVQ